MRVEYLDGTHDGALVRFHGDFGSVALLREAFERLAASSVPEFDFLSPDSTPVRFELGKPSGMRLEEDALVYGGSPEQWETRARLLDPLTQQKEGFQYLDYDGIGPVAVVVTTYPDGSF
jgi:hypothetical protein